MNTSLRIAMGGLAFAFFLALGIYAQPRIGAASSLGSSQASSLPLSIQPQATTDPNGTGGGVTRGIVVVGTGTAQVAPDVAFVNVGVQSRGQTAKEAQDSNNQTMANVIARIKALGIPDQNIQTSGIGLSPVIQQSNVINGYQATNSVTVRVDDVNNAGPVMDAAVAAGANNAGSIQFGLKDPSAATKQALDAAAKDAQGKADAIAKALGVQVKGIDSAVEQSTSVPRPYTAAAPAVARDSAQTPIQPGETTITAHLQVTYSY